MAYGALLAAIACFSVIVGACGGHANPSAAKSSAADPYGAKKFTPHYPSFLPKGSFKSSSTDKILTGTESKPALSIDGVDIETKTTKWSVLIDVSGPIVPGEGLPYQPRSTTCTWTVTMTDATATVPIALADFDSIDHLGNIYRMKPVAGQPPIPTSISKGQEVTFKMRAYEIVGEGIMRWAPIDHKILAEWDYEVEND